MHPVGIAKVLHGETHRTIVMTRPFDGVRVGENYHL